MDVIDTRSKRGKGSEGPSTAVDGEDGGRGANGALNKAWQSVLVPHRALLNCCDHACGRLPVPR